MSRTSDLRRELVIPVRSGHREDIEVARRRLESTAPGETYQSALVVIAGADEGRADGEAAEVRAALAGAWKSALNVFHPRALYGTAGGDDVGAILLYLAETRPAKMGREAFALDVVVQPGWQGLLLATGMLMALREEIRCVDALTGIAIQATVPPILERRVLFRTQATGAPSLSLLVGSSPCMQRLRDTLKHYAPLPFPVLLEGETGVGKELCARVLHDASGRGGPFIAMNGALLDPHRAEDDLCGHAKDAFTNARAERAGRIREARKGTFFLDEILSVPLSIQPMLLRIFNHAMDGELEVTPLGTENNEKVDVRLITAMQPTLDAERSPVRDDLLFRVDGLRVVIPPLRERGDDVLEIADSALAQLFARLQRGPRTVDPRARSLLRENSWPGNVRQLHGVIRRAWASSLDADALTEDRLRPHMPIERNHAPTGRLRSQVRHFVDRRIGEARTQHPRSDNAAARALGFDKGQALKRYQQQCEKDAASEAHGGRGGDP